METAAKKKNRTHYAKLNSGFSLLSSILKIILGFVLKTVFIQTLGKTYLGASSLFSEILQFLSVAELGIGTAIVFSMYKAIRENDASKVQALYKLYKKCYIVIGSILLGAGLCVIPALPLLIANYKDYDFLNLPVIYVLYLLNTVLPYFLFSYKNCILNAHQEGYFIKIVNLIIEIVKSVVLIVILYATKNFYIYLTISIFFSIFVEFVASIIAMKRHPEIFKKNDSFLTKEEKKVIFTDIAALALYQIGGKLYAATDNMIISKMLGLDVVGVYSNYSMMILYVTTMVQSIFFALTPSVANINEEDYEKKQDIYNKINYLVFVLFGITAICLVDLLNPFITIWLKEDSYLLEFPIVIVITLNYLLPGLVFSAVIFRDAYGLYKYGKFRPLIQGIINIILSILLGWKLGLIGIFIATTVSFILTILWFEPYIVHKRVLKVSPLKFYLKYILELITIVLVASLVYYVNSFIKIEGWGGFVLKLISTGGIATVCIGSISLIDPNYKYYLNMVCSKLRRKKRNEVN
ncbi:MAG: oligosaccharide flippase family protein [Anaeroplasmataceae bacterium]|nr:oligosaccharide flippase family protein [Anaeroplasmataceae bacterium]